MWQYSWVVGSQSPKAGLLTLGLLPMLVCFLSSGFKAEPLLACWFPLIQNALFEVKQP